MSSNHSSLPIGIADISIIRNVIRRAGFQYEEPMGEMDRGAARHVIDLYQHGTQKPEELILAVSGWADRFVTARKHPRTAGMVL
jgi:hypothetical protein